MKKNILVTRTALILFGCSSSQKTQQNTLSTDMNTSLMETYWKLTELMGQPVITTEIMNKEMHIIIKKEGNTITGHGGCNSFRGTYTVKEGTDRVSFSQMASTLMACVNMKKETIFLDVLQKADNYAIKGNVLSLNKARMSPLAKFEAVLMK